MISRMGVAEVLVVPQAVCEPQESTHADVGEMHRLCLGHTLTDFELPGRTLIGSERLGHTLTDFERLHQMHG